MNGVQPNVDYSPTASTTTGRVFHFFGALGVWLLLSLVIVWCWRSRHPFLPHLRPSKKPMWKGVIVAYIVVALFYFPVALIGYWVFGNKVEDNVLLSLQKPRWLVAAANMFAVIHVIGSYQAFAMPVFNMVESFFITKMHLSQAGFYAFVYELFTLVGIVLGVVLMILGPIGGLRQIILQAKDFKFYS
ncbi:hypothetical protein LWI28_014649 [Acer negundo]|uniref:Amino acid transporter transmembrane domain-containing protein n=1 Tax=Acer negundo TaxID=4023 RepID=A0AAD5IR68_ACENE|nr:hypothetical protein LWI28_014649 [Acer negundo]